MLKFIATIDWQQASPCLFITLTYPDTVRFQSYVEYSRQRALFWRAVETRLGRECPCMWRMEWKPRLTGRRKGQYMPHFHLMVFTCRWLPKLWVNDTWKSIIHHHDYLRTEVKGMRNQKQVGYYVSKYSAKLDSSLVNDPYRNTIPSGRQWGKLREERIPLHPADEVNLPDCSLVEFARDKALNGREQFNPYGNPSFTLLGPLAEEISQIVFGCPLDDWCTSDDNA